MKTFVPLFFTLLALLFLAGCGDSDSARKWIDTLQSAKADMLSGDQGVFILFIQPRESNTTVNNVESLDTLYLLSAQETQTLVFQTDKSLNVLGYRLVNDVWMETVIYHPSELPDLDLRAIQSKIKALSGNKPIASVAIRRALSPGEHLIVSFNMKNEADAFCSQYEYDYDADEAYQTTADSKCYFDMNE